MVGHACGEDVVTEFAILPQCLPKAGERVADTTGVQKGIRKRQRRAPRLAAASPTSPRVSSSCSPEHPRRGGLLGALARNRRTPPCRPCALSVCETVLGLRSGGGIDVPLYTRRVGTSGMAYGVGMTDKMLTPGLPERREAGVINVEFGEGIIEDALLPDFSVDVVNSTSAITSPSRPRARGRDGRTFLAR